MGNTDRIDSVGNHLCEIPLDLFVIVVLIASLVGSECTVRHPLNPELILAHEEKLAFDDGPLESRGDAAQRGPRLVLLCGFDFDRERSRCLCRHVRFSANWCVACAKSEA